MKAIKLNNLDDACFLAKTMSCIFNYVYVYQSGAQEFTVKTYENTSWRPAVLIAIYQSEKSIDPWQLDSACR